MDKIKNALTKNKNPLEKYKNYKNNPPKKHKNCPRFSPKKIQKDPKLTIRPLLGLFVMFGILFVIVGVLFVFF
jgi:hypothetical protein